MVAVIITYVSLKSLPSICRALYLRMRQSRGNRQQSEATGGKKRELHSGGATGKRGTLANSLELLWSLAHAGLYTMPYPRLKSYKTDKDIIMRKTEETLAVEASAPRSNGSRDLRHMLVHGSRI